MAASSTVTRVPKKSPNSSQTAERVIIDWTSGSDGACTASLTNMFGWLVYFVTDPDATAPTDDYDITLVSEDGVDVLGGAGANRDTANTEIKAPVLSGATDSVFLCGTYTFTIANAGDSKLGRAVLVVVDSL